MVKNRVSKGESAFFASICSRGAAGPVTFARIGLVGLTKCVGGRRARLSLPLVAIWFFVVRGLRVCAGAKSSWGQGPRRPFQPFNSAPQWGN